MTSISTTTSYLGKAPRRCGGGAAWFLQRLLGRLTRWEDRNHLHALSDHMLRDLGIMRDQIDDVMRGRVLR